MQYIPEPTKKPWILLKPRRILNQNVSKLSTEAEKKPNKLKILKQFEDNIIKNKSNLFKLEKENKVIKGKLLELLRLLLGIKKRIIANRW